MTGGGRRRRESETSAAAAAATGTTVVAAAASTTSGAGGWTGAEESRARDRREQSIRRRGAAGRYRRTNQTAASWPLATAPGTEEYTGVAVLWGPTADEEYGVASTTAASTTGAAEPWTMNPSTDGTTLGVSERVTMAGPHTEPSPRLSSSVSERGPAVLGTASSPSGSQDDGADFVEDGGARPHVRHAHHTDSALCLCVPAPSIVARVNHTYPDITPCVAFTGNPPRGFAASAPLRRLFIYLFIYLIISDIKGVEHSHSPAAKRVSQLKKFCCSFNRLTLSLPVPTWSQHDLRIGAHAVSTFWLNKCLSVQV